MKLIVNENSYVTVREADNIIANYLTSDDEMLSAYDNLDDDDKSIILYKSCIDMQRLKYRGFKKDNSQVLAFPRINKLGYNSDDNMVKLAQVINALSYMSEGNSTNNKISELRDNDVSNFKLGSFSISLNGSGSSVAKSNSGSVEKFLGNWLTGGIGIR